MNAVTEVMDELRKALALVDQLGDARDKAERELAELQRRTSEALAQAVEWQRERDEARADLARSVAAWEAAGMQGRTAHDALIVIAEERDEARASSAEAYKRGAEAMREACQQWCRAWENNGEAIADALADLRVEDKP